MKPSRKAKRKRGGSQKPDMQDRPERAAKRSRDDQVASADISFLRLPSHVYHGLPKDQQKTVREVNKRFSQMQRGQADLHRLPAGSHHMEATPARATVPVPRSQGWGPERPNERIDRNDGRNGNKPVGGYGVSPAAMHIQHIHAMQAENAWQDDNDWEDWIDEAGPNGRELIRHDSMQEFVNQLNAHKCDASKHTPAVQSSAVAASRPDASAVAHAEPAPPALLLSSAAQAGEVTNSLTMLLHVTAERPEASRKKAGQRLTALADTGSTHCFLSQKCKSCVPYNGAKGRVKLADSIGYAECKFGTVKLNIAGYAFEQTVGVLDMNPQSDLVLGNDWFMRNKAVLNYDSGEDSAHDARCIKFKCLTTSNEYTAALAHQHRRSMLNSVIYNTIADVRRKVQFGENDNDPNPVTKMFIVEVSRSLLTDWDTCHLLQPPCSMMHPCLTHSRMTMIASMTLNARCR